MIMHIYCPTSKLTMSKLVQVTFTRFFFLYFGCVLFMNVHFSLKLWIFHIEVSIPVSSRTNFTQYVQSHADMTLYHVNKHVPVLYLNTVPHNMYNHHKFGSYF